MPAESMFKANYTVELLRANDMVVFDADNEAVNFTTGFFVPLLHLQAARRIA